MLPNVLLLYESLAEVHIPALFIKGIQIIQLQKFYKIDKQNLNFIS